MEDSIHRLEKQISQNKELIKDVPILRSCYDTIASEVTQIAYEAEGPASPTVAGTQYVILSYAVMELNDCLVTNLEKDYHFAVESISRIAIEHSVNLMYLLNEEQRPYSLLVHYFDTAYEKTQKWLRFSRKTGDEIGVTMAKIKLDSITWYRKNSIGNKFNSLSKWPNTFERFKAVGLEELYRTVYAAASDSVHSLSEDVFNFTLGRSFPQEYKQTFLEAYLAEKKAFAVYLVATAMSCWCTALIQLAEKINMDESKNLLLKTGDTIKEICNKHNTSVEDLWLGRNQA